MNADDIISGSIVVFVFSLFALGIGYSLGCDSVNENEIIMLMIKDPAPAIEIMKTGKWPELSDEGFVPGSGMSAGEFITFQGLINND